MTGPIKSHPVKKSQYLSRQGKKLNAIDFEFDLIFKIEMQYGLSVYYTIRLSRFSVLKKFWGIAVYNLIVIYRDGKLSCSKIHPVKWVT
jgi:hypothetical protein